MKSQNMLDIRSRVDNAFKDLKSTSVIKSSKNMVEVIEEFNKRQRTYGAEEYLHLNGFVENKPSNASKKKEITTYSSTINEFLQKLGIDEKLLLEENAPREKGYKVYQFIIDNLPVLNQALSIMAGAVLTPEMYSTDTIVYDETDGSDNIPLIENIIEKTNIEKELPNWIRNSLLLGDEFVEIVDTKTVRLAMEENIILTESPEYDNYVSLLESCATELSELGYNGDENLLEMVSHTKVPDNDDTEAFMFLKENASGTRPKDEETTDTEDRLDSIYLKTHKPENIIIIKVGSFILGYLDINTESVDLNRNSKQQTSNLFNNGTVQYTNFNGGPTIGGDLNKKALDRVTDALSDIIMSQLDKERANISKFLRKNEDFRDVIYNVVVNKQKTSIRFIPPERVIHWKNEADEDNRYGASIFAPMLLLIKHYLAVMTHHTIFNLTRGTEKRKITVEVSSLDMDSGGALNNVIKSFKQKEQSLINQLNNINSIGTELTAYDDVFLPRINGETPIEIDSIPGQQDTLDPEYLETLKSNILNGIRVPKSLLNEVENSYRTSLAQENIMFANQIIYLQKQYEPMINDLVYRILSIITGETAERDVKLKFNPPSTLLNESLSANIGNVQGIIQFISELYGGDGSGGMGGFGDDNDGNETNGIDKKELAKMFVKGIDWREIDKLYYAKIDKDNTDDITGREDADNFGMGEHGNTGVGPYGGRDTFDSPDFGLDNSEQSSSEVTRTSRDGSNTTVTTNEVRRNG